MSRCNSAKVLAARLVARSLGMFPFSRKTMDMVWEKKKIYSEWPQWSEVGLVVERMWGPVSVHLKMPLSVFTKILKKNKRHVKTSEMFRKEYIF